MATYSAGIAVIKYSNLDDESDGYDDDENDEEDDLFDNDDDDEDDQESLETSGQKMSRSSSLYDDYEANSSKEINQSDDFEDGARRKRHEDEDDEYDEDIDPFRQAPLYVYNFGKSKSSQNTSSSSSSQTNTSTTSTNTSNKSFCSSSANTSVRDDPSNESCDSVSVRTKTSIGNSSSVIGVHSSSAFQPYKKQPDPFISAPFEFAPPTTSGTSSNQQRKVSASSTSNSVTPTNNVPSGSTPSNQNRNRKRSESCKKQPGTSIEYSTLGVSNTRTEEDEELIQVIKRGEKLIKPVQTPSDSSKNKMSHKSLLSGHQNPFVAAPFTGNKKPSAQSRLIHNTLANQPVLTSSNSSSGSFSTAHKSTDAQILKMNLNYDSYSSNNIKRASIPQSQSLNEMKPDHQASCSQQSGPDPTRSHGSNDFVRTSENSSRVQVSSNGGGSQVASKPNQAGGISNMSFDDY